ncbi:PLC-like phosphodiesterase [Clohesyomyces aquaticus]|uniref:PLC-like phosphodiesterase n=1 Tax=Clohesyomyces aquaticus TaxID=1231657 RepID=A0A1Y1ZT47_9PLEO|nr:PLC-like phosphodiesterase [Clohesyomyces aquaticus]
MLFVQLAYIESESLAQPTMFRHLIPGVIVLLANCISPSAASKPSDLRLNHIQVIGTHNSYHREINLAERAVFEKYVPSPQNYYYSHSTLSNQLQHQSVRSLEIDLHSDEKGGLYYPPLIWTLSNLTEEQRPFDGDILKKPGIKVFHVTDLDPNAVCHTFVDCLKDIKKWSDANRQHVPILIDLELKTDGDACAIGGVCGEEAKNWTLSRLINVDAEIRSVFSPKQLITPDDVRHKGLTLEQSVLQHGWPRLDDMRGRFMFYFDNDPKPNITSDPRNLYTAGGHESLQNRTVFTNALEGSPDCAFIKHNEPTGANLAEIQRLVKKGYIVRTRADVPIDTVMSKNTTMRDSAFKSGAQIVSTDYPVYGMAVRYDWDYVAQLEGARVAKCNPVTAPGWCRDEMVE